jgi:hypothetical protein
LADQERCLPILDNFPARRRTGHGDAYDEVIATRRRQLKIRAIAEFLAQVEAVPVGDLLARCVRQSSLSTRRFIHGLGRTDVSSADRPRTRTLTRSHEKLALDYRDTGDLVALGVETPRGWVEELAVSSFAREAIAFCVNTSRFEVQDLPGHLTDDERWAIAEVLEESALFRAEAGE